jgi:hypothetical protein
MNLYNDLHVLGSRVDATPETRKNVFTLELTTGVATKHKTFCMPQKAITGRATDAATYPCPTYDSKKVVLNPESVFWEVHLPIFKKSRALYQAAVKFLEGSLSYPEIEPNNWVALTFKDTPVGSLESIGDACSKACNELFQSRKLTILGEDGSPGCLTEPSLLSGAKGGTKARLQPEVNGIGLAKANGKLHSVNEGANEFHGMEQGHNFMIEVDEAITVVTGLSYALANNAVHTNESSIVMIPTAGTTHQIIGISQGILGMQYSDKEVVECCWKDLSELKSTSDPIHLIQLRPSMSRISIRNLAATTAGAIRDNLFLFQKQADYQNPQRVNLRRLMCDLGQKQGGSFEPIYPESVIQDTMWALMTGSRLPQQLFSISSGLYLANLTKWVELNYYRGHGIPQKEEKVMPITFKEEKNAEELEDKIRLMDGPISDVLCNELAYTWGRYIASFHHMRISYHKGRKAPECKEIRTFLANPQSCFANMNPDLYRERTPHEYREHFKRVVVAANDIPRGSLNNIQKGMVVLGYEHQNAGLYNYRSEKNRVVEAEEGIV